MASPLNISNIHSYVLTHDNETANLKAFFTLSFDIQITDSDLLNKWVIYRFNICAVTNVKDYKL